MSSGMRSPSCRIPVRSARAAHSPHRAATGALALATAAALTSAAATTDAAQTLPAPDRPTTLGVVVAPGPDRDRNLAGADYIAMPNEELPLADLAGRVLAHCGFRVVDAAPQSAETPDATLTIRARGNSIGGRYGEMRVGFTGADLTGDLVLDGGGYIHAARFSAVLYPSLLYPTPRRDGLTAAQPVAATFLAVLAGDGRPAPDSAEVWRPILEGTVYLDALIDLAADACGTAGLARAAYDAMPALRSRAIDRLAVRAAGDPEARAALLARLDDPDPDVHRDIADAVAAGGVTEAVAPLRDRLAAEPPEYAARGAVERAIARLTDTLPPRYAWQSLARWDFIEWGITTPSRVRELLGEPESVGAGGEWRYGSGWVEFSPSGAGRDEADETTVDRIRYPRPGW
jgi:hypothetical protein